MINKKKNKGITLLEMITAAGILILIIVTVSPFLKTTTTAFERDAILNHMMQEARLAMDKITEELKHTNEIISIDANFIKFGTSGEEYYLDDGNAGHSTTGTWEDGTLQGGYAGDYDRSNVVTSTAYYRFSPVVSGPYDVYVYFIATSTNTNQARYRLFDAGGASYSTADVNQRISGAPAWRPLWDANTVNLSTAGTRLEVWSTGLGGTGTNYTVADGVKFVYKGFRQRIFYFASNRIYYGSDADIEPQTPSERILAENIYQIGAIPFLTYFQMDGVTPATSAMNVALIRIAFEIRDPQNRVPPYRITGQVLRRVSPAARRLVINEINYSPPPSSIIAATDFDGNNIGGWSTDNWIRHNNWIENFENGTNGWLTTVLGAPFPTGCNVATTAPWQLGQETTIWPDPFDSTSVNLWGTNLTGNYNNCANQRLYSPTITLPTGAGTLRFGFSYCHRIRPNEDYAYVELSTGGGPYSVVATGTGFVNNWTFYSRDISLYKGYNANFGFRFWSDNLQTLRGWYNENFVIFAEPGASSTLISNTNNMVTSGNRLIWQFGQPLADQVPPGAYSGTQCAGTLLRNDYPEVIDAGLISPAISLVGKYNVTLRYHQFINVEDGGCYDGMRVEISTQGVGGPWIQLTPKIGYSYTGTIAAGRYNILQGSSAYCADTGWQLVEFSVPSFAVGSDNVRFRWRFASDNVGTNDMEHSPGVFIDDVYVIEEFSAAYQWIELYNPTIFPVNINQWRIYADTHIGSGDNFDTIQQYAGGGTIIPPGGYAIIVPNDIDPYDNRPYVYSTNPSNPYNPLIPSSALKLVIDDTRFGHVGMGFDFGKITIKDASNNLVDYVGYNIAFYDDMERTDAGYPLNIWSTGDFTENVDGNTVWDVGDPSSATNFDRTLGKFGIATGRCWYQRRKSAPFTVENYYPRARCDLRTPAIDLRGATDAAGGRPAQLVFYYFMDVAGGATEDGGHIQISEVGGANFQESDFAGVLSPVPAYDGIILDTLNVLNTQPAYYMDQLVWRRVAVDLSAYYGKIIMLRWYFGADDTGQLGGWFLDDICVWFPWGGYKNKKTIERKSTFGDSTSWQNWEESAPDYGTPGAPN